MVCAPCSAAGLSTPAPPEPLPLRSDFANQLLKYKCCVQIPPAAYKTVMLRGVSPFYAHPGANGFFAIVFSIGMCLICLVIAVVQFCQGSNPEC